MAKKSTLIRGFKAESERKSEFYRNALGYKPESPLCAFELAKHLGVEVYKPSDIFPPETNLDVLLGTSEKNNGWSALTMTTEKENRIIIYNDRHHPTRQQSDLMHELSHIICEHKQKPREEELPFFMREHDVEQEDEAIYLGSVLQMTRKGLLSCVRSGMTDEEIADHFNASKSMVTFRINSTGVRKQNKVYRKFA